MFKFVIKFFEKSIEEVKIYVNFNQALIKIIILENLSAYCVTLKILHE